MPDSTPTPIRYTVPLGEDPERGRLRRWLTSCLESNLRSHTLCGGPSKEGAQYVLQQAKANGFDPLLIWGNAVDLLSESFPWALPVPFSYQEVAPSLGHRPEPA